MSLANLVALRQVIEARGGISEAAKKSGLARQSIYRALSTNGNSTITTLAQLDDYASRNTYYPMELTLLMANLTGLSLSKGQNRKFLFKCSRWSMYLLHTRGVNYRTYLQLGI